LWLSEHRQSGFPPFSNAAALQAMSAASGLPVSKAAVRDTVVLIRDHVRVGWDLPPRQTRRLNHASSATNGKNPLLTAAATEYAGSPIASAAGISN